MAAGIVVALYKELGQANDDDARVKLGQSDGVSYLEFAAESKRISQLVNAALDMADELISDQPDEMPGIFQEPPVGIDKGSRVLLETDPVTEYIRPKLQPGTDGLVNLKLPEGLEHYAERLNEYIYRGLKIAGRLPMPLTIRAHLGQFMLRTYPIGKKVYEYDDFHAMVNHPRASGCLKTRLGNETLAQRILDFARNDTSGLFQPIGNQSTLAADVLPEYMLEVHSQRAKFHTPLRTRIGVKSGSARATNADVYQPYRVITCGADAHLAELDVLNLSVGKGLDWKLEAVKEEQDEKAFPDVVQYLRSLKFDLQASDNPHHLDVYPLLQSNEETNYSSTAAKLKDASVKTAYNFRWKSTSYVVQVAINHRWAGMGVMGMTKRSPLRVDVGISVFGEYWGLEDEADGNDWGDELEILLDDGDGTAPASGTTRVANFLQVIGDIRDTLEPLLEARV
ncbi:hypothetical protein GGR52DRAFT_573503 [Hypoxylon sp. FL1284]|nr:hypothetical protein GGR52DRAFT_573503 [Hypoxylon sp. FL1284]